MTKIFVPMPPLRSTADVAANLSRSGEISIAVIQPLGAPHAADFDVFLTYRTNVALAVREEQSLRRVDVPTAIQVGASYGVTVLANVAPEVKAFVAFMISTEGQRVPSEQGFQSS